MFFTIHNFSWPNRDHYERKERIFPSTERRVLEEKLKFVRPSVRPRKGQKNMIDERSLYQGFYSAVRSNSMRGARIEGPITNRTPLVSWQPMKIEISGIGFVGGNSMWGARIEGPITHRTPLVGWEPMEIEISAKGFVRGNLMWGARIEGPITHRTPLVGWEPMKIEISGIGFVRGNSMRGARIEGPITHRTPLVGWEPMKIEISAIGFVGGNSMWGARIEGPITHRTPLVGWEPMKIEISAIEFVRGISTRGTRIRDPNTSKSHWSTGNQWKSTWPKTSFSEQSPCGDHKSGSQKRWNNSRGPRVLLVDRESMEIELAGNKLFWGIWTRGIRICGSKHVEATVVVQEYWLRL